MLFITTSKNAQAASRYFKDSLSVEDYYSEKHEITGCWHGAAAGWLGLPKEVSGSDFEAMLNNHHPITGEKLTARNSKNRRPMYDFTFNAPKSVSLVHAITGDDDILQAHREAVLEAMKQVEQDVQTQSGTGKKKHYVTTGNIAFAEFIHTTTRPIETTIEGKKKYAPEPHLHSHCAVINATWYEAQGRYRALELGNVKGQAAYYEALYHAHMAQQLKKSGYQLSRNGKRWEIAGIERDLIEKFSTRSLEIEAIAKERGIKSADAKAQLGRLTRNSKNKSVTNSQLYELWNTRLTDDEYQSIMTAKRSVEDTDGGESSNNPMAQICAKRYVDLALEHCLERHSAVPEKKLLACAIDMAGGTVSPENIRADLKSRSNILGAEKKTVRYITTVEMDTEEELLIVRAAQGRSKHRSINPDYAIERDYLNEGQRAAIHHVLNSRDEIMIVSGDAGVGKTTLMQEVKSGVEQSGKKILAFAPSSDASRSVLRSKGFEGAETIAMLLNSERLQEQIKDNVMLIDEAGLIGVPTMNRILDIAQEQNARVILSGDWKQHSAVERGDALKILETKPELPVARVTEIMRQKGKKLYKAIIERIARAIGIKHQPEYRQKAIAEAFDELDKGGSVLEIEDRTARHKALATEYLKASSESHNDVIVVAPTHREGRDITSSIRDTLKSGGRLEKNERAYIRLKDKQYTGAQKQIAGNYTAGDVIEFHQNVKGYKAGQRYSVTGRDDMGRVLITDHKGESESPLLSEHTHAFSVYEEETIHLSVHDRLRITKNSKSMDSSHLHNGQVYTITGFDEEGNIALSNGQYLSKHSRHFNHGYVTTSHASQGKDARTVLIAQSVNSFAASNDKQFYVSVSRGVENCFIYTDDKDGLREAISENGDGMSAQEIADEARKVHRKEKRRRARIRRFSQELDLGREERHLDNVQSENLEQNIEYRHRGCGELKYAFSDAFNPEAS